MTAMDFQLVDEFWAAFLGCAAEELRREQVLVVRHAAMEGYSGLWIFWRRSACIISAPDAILASVTAAVAGRRPHQLFNRSALVELFAPSRRVVGPAALLYVDRHNFRPSPRHAARPLGRSDHKAMELLRDACGQGDWELSGLEIGGMPACGCFAGEQLVSAAGYAVWMDKIAHLGVATHPEHRNQGYGRSAAGAATHSALDAGLIVQYRTLQSNSASMRLARELGFRNYGAHFAVRLRNPERDLRQAVERAEGRILVKDDVTMEEPDVFIDLGQPGPVIDAEVDFQTEPGIRE